MSRQSEIRARVEAASEGPWKRHTEFVNDVWTGKDGRMGSILTSVRHHKLGKMGEFKDLMGEDAEFVAHARQDIPWLLDRLESVEAELAEAKG